MPALAAASYDKYPNDNQPTTANNKLPTRLPWGRPPYPTLSATPGLPSLGLPTTPGRNPVARGAKGTSIRAGVRTVPSLLAFAAY